MPMWPFISFLVCYLLRKIIDPYFPSLEWQTIEDVWLIQKLSEHIYLLFADDLLLFVKANTHQARVVTDTIAAFCNASCQTISTAKLIAYDSQGVSRESKLEIQQITGIQFTE